jgi:hypothetical protein
VFMVGQYAWDEQSQIATITPFQSLDLSMSGLLSELSVTLPARPKPAPKPKKPGIVNPGGPAHHLPAPRRPRVNPGGPARRPAPPAVNPGGPARRPR